MGDVIEMTTWPSHQNTFYRLSAGGLTFEVKGAAGASIGLAKKPGNTCDVWVVIGQDNYTWIRKREGGGKAASTPNILNNEEYRRFWLSWRGGSIQLGRSQDRTPIVSHTNKIDLCYVTFSAGQHVLAERNPVHWRFELPPVLEKPIMKSVTNGKLRWVQANSNNLPDGALIGGYEKETLYIIRAPHQGSLTPGKFVPSKGMGYISWSWESHVKNEFEVLCGFDCTWVPSSDDKIPVGAVEGGYSENLPREKLYVGRALHCGHLIPGKVQVSHRVCFVAFEDREVPHKKYEILVSSGIYSRCAHKLLVDHINVSSPPESVNGDDEDYDPDDGEFDEDDQY